MTKLAGYILILLAFAATPSLAQEQAQIDRLIDRAVKHVNLQRAMNGLQPLRLDRRLTRAAQKHSENMVARDFLDHVAPDGRRLENRVVAEGYQWRAIAENLSGGISSPERTVDSWMTSPAHRDNLLGDNYVHVGIGYAQPKPGGRQPRYRHYWTAVFGAPGR